MISYISWDRGFFLSAFSSDILLLRWVSKATSRSLNGPEGCQVINITTACLLSSRARDPLSQTKKVKEHAAWSDVCSKCTTSPNWVPRSLPICLNIGMLYRDCSYQQICGKLGRDQICRCVSNGTRSNQQSFLSIPSALSKTLWFSTYICPMSTISPYSNELRSLPCLK